MADSRGVLIVGEFIGKGLAGITSELLGVGRKLANSLGEELSAVFLGNDIKDTAAGAFTLGADKVYVVDDQLLHVYQPESYATILERMCKEMAPSVVAIGVTYMGRDLACRLACRLETGLAMDCVDLNIDPESKALIATRPVYGGKALAEVDCGPRRPALATVRAKSQEPAQPDPSRKGEVIPVSAEIDASLAKTRVVDMIPAETQGIRLEDARIVVGGGRGLGSVEGWKRLEELAVLLGAAVGSTRGACDEGYCSVDTQLGITAKSVGPELYIAVGISGASQHMSGVASKHIVCINKDANAAIFRHSEYGVVGRWEDVVPAFLKKCKELLAE